MTDVQPISAEHLAAWRANSHGVLEMFGASFGNTATPRPSTAVHIDRSAEIVYPAWMRGLLHPAEGDLPEDYDMQSDIELWDYQADEGFTGDLTVQTFYEGMLKCGQPKRFLNLADGRALIRKGAPAFSEAFGEETNLFLWGAATTDRNDTRSVPFMCVFGNSVQMNWKQFTQNISSNFRGAWFKDPE